MDERRPVIVYAIDPSAPGRAGLAWARDLAASRHADLHVVCVQRTEHDTPDVTGSRGVPDGCDVRLTGSQGDPAELDAYARKVEAVLIVIDTQYRHRGLWRAPASTARSLGGRTECPVLVIPQHAGEPAPLSGSGRAVVCAVDYSVASLNAVRVGASLAGAAGTRLHLLHVIEGFPGRSILSGAEAMRVQRGFEALVAREQMRLRRLVPVGTAHPDAVEAVVESGVAHRSIVELAARTRASAIVLGAAQRSLLDEVIAGATITNVLRRAGSPVLLVPAALTAAHPAAPAGGYPWIAAERELTAAASGGR